MLYFDFMYTFNWELQSTKLGGNTSGVGFGLYILYTWFSHNKNNSHLFHFLQEWYIKRKLSGNFLWPYNLIHLHPFCSTKGKCTKTTNFSSINIKLRNQTWMGVYSSSRYVQTYHKFLSCQFIPLNGSCKAVSHIKPYLSSYLHMTFWASEEIFPTFVACLRVKNGLKRNWHIKVKDTLICDWN